MKAVLIIALLFSAMAYAEPEKAQSPHEVTARNLLCEGKKSRMLPDVRFEMQKALRETPENYWNILISAGVSPECIRADIY